ncbi:MAG TPA: hypothetical protein VG253_11400 [Streptosporangiaceae bacterium]|nr:hypothetical protein [Streptosporangiaceae bacterium]
MTVQAQAASARRPAALDRAQQGGGQRHRVPGSAGQGGRSSHDNESHQGRSKDGTQPPDPAPLGWPDGQWRQQSPMDAVDRRLHSSGQGFQQAHHPPGHPCGERDRPGNRYRVRPGQPGVDVLEAVLRGLHRTGRLVQGTAQHFLGVIGTTRAHA